MKHRSRFALSLIVCFLVIAAVALITGSILSGRIDRTQRELLLIQAKQASLLVSQTEIASLSGTTADLSSPLYQHLKSQFTKFREANPEIRFVYLMGYHPEIRTQFFYVDSEPTNSNDYSPPGQLFPDTRPEDIDAYLAGIPYTDGPYEDSWGEWVSGYVPLAGASGEIVAMVGIDTATNIWQEQIAFMRTTVGIIAILTAILSLFIAIRLYRKQQSIEILSIKNQKLEKSTVSMKEVQSMAHLGSLTMYFPERTITLDEQFRALVGSVNEGKVSLSALESVVHEDDTEKLGTMITEIETTDILYAWVDVRMGTVTGGFRKYHIYGNIKRHASGAPKRFDGIIQDITDIEK